MATIEEQETWDQAELDYLINLNRMENPLRILMPDRTTDVYAWDPYENGYVYWYTLEAPPPLEAPENQAAPAA